MAMDLGLNYILPGNLELKLMTTRVGISFFSNPNFQHDFILFLPTKTTGQMCHFRVYNLFLGGYPSLKLT